MSKRRAYHWYFGTKAGIDFSSGVAVSNPQTSIYLDQREGCDSISSDVAGDFVFYTNGSVLVDKDFNLVEQWIGGADLEPNLSMQAVSIVRAPGSSTLYYLFFVGNWGTSDSDHRDARYRTYDSTTKTLGSLTTLASSGLSWGYAENLTTVLKPNGEDYWIISVAKGNSAITVWSLTSSGVTLERANNSICNLTGANRYGQIKVSPDGEKLVIAMGGTVPTGEPVITVYDFDNSNAATSNPIVLLREGDVPNAEKIIGVDFSPNSRKVYATAYAVELIIYKFALWGPTCTTQITKSFPTYPGGGGAIQRGPDNLLYVALNNQQEVMQITNPDSDDDTILTNVLDLSPGYCRLGLPVTIQAAFATTTNDYRVMHNNHWYSVCDGDVISVFDGTNWNTNGLIPNKSKYKALDDWHTIGCNVQQTIDYDCKGITSFASGTGSTVIAYMSADTTGFVVGEEYRIIESSIYGGLVTVTEIYSDRVVFEGTYSGNETGASFLLPQEQIFIDTIQALIDAESSGGTVRLLPGTYKESLTLTLPPGISINGSGMNSTKILAIGGQGDIMSANSTVVTTGNQSVKNVEFDGNKRSSDRLLSVFGRNNFTVENVRFVESRISGLRVNYGTSLWTTGFSCKYNEFINCAEGYDAWGYGGLMPERISYSEIAYNTFNITGTNGAYDGGFGIKGYDWSHLSVHDNNITVDDVYRDGSGRPIGIECWSMHDEVDVYGNTVNGWISLVGGAGGAGSGTYSVDCYDNIVDLGTSSPTGSAGIETMVDDAIVRDNYILNARDAIAIWPGNHDYVDNIQAYRNIIEITRTDWGSMPSKGILIQPSYKGGNADAHVTNVKFWNNTVIGTAQGFSVRGLSVNDPLMYSQHLQCHNNIFDNCTNGIYMWGISGGTVRVDDVSFQSNNFYNCNTQYSVGGGNIITNNDYSSGNQVNYNPVFVGTGDKWDTYYELQGTSQLIDAGMDVGLPYNGSAPDIGAKETT